MWEGGIRSVTLKAIFKLSVKLTQLIIFNQLEVLMAA